MAASETTKDSISSDEVVETAVRKGNSPLPPVRKPTAATSTKPHRCHQYENPPLQPVQKPTAATKVGCLEVDFYSAYCKSKCEEWSLKGAYPLVEKVAQLMSDPSFCLGAWPPAKNYYSFAGNSQSQQQQNQQQPQQQNHHVITNHVTETLHHLGWTAIDALDTRAFDKLQLAGDNLLLVGPDVGAALRQRTDSSRFACSLAFWEQRLPCLETYWQLYETMESFELNLQNFTGMGLLNNPQRRCFTYRDFLLPSVHLGEVWGHRLSRFLKTHDRYRLTRAAAPPAVGKSETGAAASSSTVVAELAFSPLNSGDKSGRRRLNQLEEMKDSEQVKELLSLSGTSWFSLVLQACPGKQMLVIGRRFVLETFLLLAPRRNPVAFGFAAFFHPGLVRVRASMSPGKNKQPQKPQEHDEEETIQQQHLEVIEPCRDQTTFTWLPEQLTDYLAAAVKPPASTEFKDWLTSAAYPQVRAACAYLASALGQQVTDSAHVRYHLLRLSFVVEISRRKDGRERRRVRLDDISQRVTHQPQAASSSQAAAATAIDYCESLVLPRVMQESALILSELLVRTTHTGDLPARALTSLQNMCPVFDSVDPGVQREILARN